MRTLLLAAVASVGLVGCVGSLDGGMTGDDTTDPVGPGTNPNPNPDSQARKKFEQNVYPIIKNAGQASDCFSCHSAAGPSGNVTGFVAPDLADAYATATSYQIVVGNFAPSAAGILTKIAAGHQGRTYSQAQIDAITDWLNTEVSERSNNPTQPPASGGNETYAAATARVLNQWSACMTTQNFTAANMANAFGNMQANNGETCRSCHSTGGYGFMATTITETNPQGGPPGLFTTMATNQYYLVMYYSVDLSDTTRGTDGKLTNAKMKVNMDSFKGVATNTAPHVQHPSFNYQNNQMMTALNTFYTSTMAAVTAGNCGPTKLDPPAQ